ncbi:MAG TPA: cell division topological specificity factor MinE [Candidatus Baltobacteraceae bacterium]|nr:cell division topological specificity factor MinE [Candidatus Baltobacteraceae bacterium]
MIDWIKKFFGAPSSSSTAKERLRLVLMTDHLALGPDIVENMKRDLIDVISRYVEVDRDKVEVSFEREDRALAMLANIPIVSVSRPSPPPAPPDPPANGGAPPRRRRRKKPPAQNPAAAH